MNTLPYPCRGGEVEAAGTAYCDPSDMCPDVLTGRDNRPYHIAGLEAVNSFGGFGAGAWEAFCPPPVEKTRGAVTGVPRPPTAADCPTLFQLVPYRLTAMSKVSCLYHPPPTFALDHQRDARFAAAGVELDLDGLRVTAVPLSQNDREWVDDTPPLCPL